MIFRLNKNHNPFNLRLKIDDVDIDQVNNTNFLGVSIDNKLTWTEHVNSIHGKISMSIGVMRKLRSILPKKTLFMLYNAFVLPYLNYCSIVWSGTSSSNLQRLYVLQKKAIRICSNANYLAHTAPMFKDLNALTIFDNVSLKLGMFMYKHVNAFSPDVFHDYFPMNYATHTFNTRNKQNAILPYCRLSLKQKNSILYKGTKLWNNLSPFLKNANTTSAFKSKFKQHLINSY